MGGVLVWAWLLLGWAGASLMTRPGYHGDWEGLQLQDHQWIRQIIKTRNFQSKSMSSWTFSTFDFCLFSFDHWIFLEAFCFFLLVNLRFRVCGSYSASWAAPAPGPSRLRPGYFWTGPDQTPEEERETGLEQNCFFCWIRAQTRWGSGLWWGCRFLVSVPHASDLFVVLGQTVVFMPMRPVSPAGHTPHHQLMGVEGYGLRAELDVLGLYCLHRFSVGLTSRDRLQHSRTLRGCLRRHYLVAMVMHLGSLSCWRIQACFMFSVMEGGFCPEPLIQSFLHRTSRPQSLCRKTAPHHDDSTPMLHTCSSFFLLQTRRLAFLPQNPFGSNNLVSWILFYIRSKPTFLTLVLS